MATPIVLPKQGNTVETCLLLEWKKKKGEPVRRGEVVCEVETDKALFEIEAPEDGVLLELFFKEGDDIPVLTNIAIVGKPGEDFSEFLPQGQGEVAKEQTFRDPKQVNHTIITSGVGSGPSGEAGGISPRARKIAEQSGIDIQGIRGTGPGGRVIERDVLAFVASSGRPEQGTGMGSQALTADRPPSTATQGPYQGDDDVRVVPLKGVRKLIAERMLASTQKSAQLTLNASTSAVNLVDVRKNFKSNGEYHQFSSVTINDLVHYAVTQVLPHHPALNCLLQDDKLYYYKDVHLGFAVDTPRGLLVPVIRHAQKLSLLDLSNEAKRLASQCVDGKIVADELTGATFTVTNLGNFGIESFTPILNLPQAAILGVNTIAPRPVDGGNGVQFVPSISFSLTIDHRVIDGVTGAKFLQELATTIAGISLKVIGNTKE